MLAELPVKSGLRSNGGLHFENLLRLIFVNKIRIKYIPKDFVTMRMGGASTAGFASRKQIMHDHLKAMKKNGVYSNTLLLSLRYFYKIYELIRGGTMREQVGDAGYQRWATDILTRHCQIAKYT